jgi:AraC-like DNA-binding protein
MVSYWGIDQVLKYVSLSFSKRLDVVEEKCIGILKLTDFLGDRYEYHLPHLSCVLSGNPSVFEQDLSPRFSNIKTCIITYYPDWVNGELLGFYLQIFEKPETNLQDSDLTLALNHFNNILIDGNSSDSYHNGNTIVDPKIEKVAIYLSSILTEEFPGVNFIAEKYFISVSKLKRDFKSAYGVSLFVYYRKLQMDEAGQYLKIKKYRIGELAAMYNFANPYNFTVCYNRFKTKIFDINFELLSLSSVFLYLMCL